MCGASTKINARWVGERVGEKRIRLEITHSSNNNSIVYLHRFVGHLTALFFCDSGKIADTIGWNAGIGFQNAFQFHNFRLNKKNRIFFHFSFFVAFVFSFRVSDSIEHCNTWNSLPFFFHVPHSEQQPLQIQQIILMIDSVENSLILPPIVCLVVCLINTLFSPWFINVLT